ncbi:MAG TPA: carboxypeptidase-like regulatory domain-containing protein [Bryobacteraceae bacterium]|nr:carboxypeptidase-like regulatory domain-containing protein [Bryobacteraceae bacterium]
MFRHQARVALGTLILLIWGGLLHAQISQASLQGSVKDPTGASVPGASVTLKDKGTGTSRSTVTSASGEYAIPNLAPADYSLTVTMNGFKTIVVGSLTLHTGENSTYNATLELGATNQEVTVDAAVPLVNTTSAEVSHLVPPSQVALLPLNGRNFWELTQLTPGATFIPRGQTAQYNGSEIRARNVNVTVNGQSYIFTGWSLDGANITNFELGGTLIQPNVDAIQEFSVAAGNMSPEYGHTPNMINASLKSGTNSYHGTLFEYLRNDKLDARNFFLAKPIPLKRNQYGFTAGGPIIRNRVFFFADLQNTSLHQGTSFNSVVPSLLERQGNFSELLPKAITNPLNRQPFAGNMIPATQISPQGAYFSSLIPTPNLLQGTTSRAAFSTQTPLSTKQGDIRIDANVTANDVLMARYSIADNAEFNPNPFPSLNGTDLHSQAQNTTLRWTRIITPKLLNVAQVSYYNSPFLFGAVLPGFDLQSQAGVSGFEDATVNPVKSFPSLSLSGYQGFQGSPSDQRPKTIIIHTWQYSDSMTYNLGRHELKFGGEWLHRRDAFSIGQNSVGNFSFVGTYTGDAFADMLLGYPDNVSRSAFQTLQGSYDDFQSLYFNDNVRVKSNLTVNVGLRFEINPFYKGIRGTRSGFDAQAGKIIVPSNLPSNAQPLTPQLLALFSDRIETTGSLGLPPSVSPAAYNWAPRVGFAWSPFGSQKTAVRGGYGIFYTFPDTNLINNTVVTVPFVDNVTVFNDRPPAAPTRTLANFFQGQPIAAANPNPGQPCAFGVAALSCDTPTITSALVHLQQQSTQQWNFSIERQVGSRIAVTVSYVANKTSHLQQGIRENDPPPGPGNIQGRRIYPQWGAIGLQEWGGKASYNALQTELRVREWHGLTLMGSYVYSRCMDNGTDEAGPVATQLYGSNYAPCDFNQKNTTSASFNYALPVGRGKAFLNSDSRWVRYTLGGWNLSSVVTAKSGLPFTPSISTDTANTGVGSQRPQVVGQPMLVGNVSCWFYVSSNPTCRSLEPNATNAFATPAQYTYGNSGRNILLAQRLIQVDLSLMKEFPFTETRRLEFRSEFFNLANHAVFGTPTTTINLASAGQVSSTLNSNRILEFALKLYF